jgi:hypothetical protein
MQIEQVKENEIINIFNQVELLKEFKTENLSIRVFQLGNEPGSADLNSGEITHNIYIAVSEFDEFPNQSLFCMKNLYATEIEKTDSSNDNFALLEISYIDNGKRKHEQLKITINEILKVSR